MSKQSGKNLVNILAEELKEWPLVFGYYPNYIVQEGDGELFSTSKERPYFGGDTAWYRSQEDDDKCGYWAEHATLSSDYATAIVTREMWEAERAKLSKPKANKDGWIRHRGGKCPVDADTIVEVRDRDGDIEIYGASDVHWVHVGFRSDIVAYRLHKPDEQHSIQNVAQIPGAQTITSSFDKEPSVRVALHNPIEWRDRITEIDRTVEALEEERVRLIQKLADEGFQLIGRK